MKTMELLKSYYSKKTEIPDGGWERTVWMSAELLRDAIRIRGTSRSSKPKQNKSVFVQEDLFN